MSTRHAACSALMRASARVKKSLGVPDGQSGVAQVMALLERHLDPAGCTMVAGIRLGAHSGHGHTKNTFLQI